MAVETLQDRAVFFDPDDFGVAVSYTRSGGATTTVNGIFDNEYLSQDAGAGVVFSVREPRFLMRESDLPTGADEGDTIVISSVTYVVKVIEPDGTGMTNLALEKQ